MGLRRQLAMTVIILAVMGVSASCQNPQTAPDNPPATADEAQGQGEESMDDESTAEEGRSDEFVDASQLYRAPIPGDWMVDEGEDLATFSSPDGGARVHLTVREAGDNLQQPIDEAWQLLADAPELTVAQTMQPPAPDGVDDYLVIHYELVDGRIAQALAYTVDGMAYVALIDGEIAAVQRRAAQMQTIATGFEATALAKTDLSEANPKTFEEQDLERLRAFAQESLDTMGIPGASIGIVQNGEIIFEEALGVRAVDDEEAMTPETLMMIGSTTKTLTTLLLANLVDGGEISWDTPVVDILPDFAVQDEELTQTITVENLVCACTGVPRRDMEIIFNYETLTAADVIDSLASFEFFTDFGETFQYSNQMVAAAGYVAAAALGATSEELAEGYAQALQERILDPLGLMATTTDFDQAQSAPAVAQPHARGFDTEYAAFDRNIERFVEPLAPAGAAWSNTRDMTRYLQFLLAAAKGEQPTAVVSTSQMEKLWAPQVDISADAQYGLGWIVSKEQGLRVLSHNGNTMGFTSEMAIFPEADVGLTVLANGGGANGFSAAIRARLVELLYDQPMRADQTIAFGRQAIEDQLERWADQTIDDVDYEQFSSFSGTYEEEALGTVELRLEEDRLVLDAGGFHTSLRLIEESQEEKTWTFLTVDPPLTGVEFTLQEGDDGRIIRFGEGLVAYEFRATQ